MPNEKTRPNPAARRRQIVKDRESDLITLERRGMQAAARVMRGLLSRLRTLPRKPGADVRQIVAEEMSGISGILAETMLAAHLTSKIQTARIAESHKKNQPMSFAVTSVFGKTIDVLEARANMSVREIAALRQKYQDVAFSATSKASAAIEKKVQKALFQVASQGTETQTALGEFSNLLAEAGLNTRANIVEAMYRTQMQVARSVAQWEENQNPIIDEVLWGYEYATAGDDRVRPTHEAMDGVKLPKDDPFWQTWFPPAGYNCRCIAIEIFTDDPASMRKEKRPPMLVKDGGILVPVTPDQGFGVNFANILGTG